MRLFQWTKQHHVVKEMAKGFTYYASVPLTFVTKLQVLSSKDISFDRSEPCFMIVLELAPSIPQFVENIKEMAKISSKRADFKPILSSSSLGLWVASRKSRDLRLRVFWFGVESRDLRLRFWKKPSRATPQGITSPVGFTFIVVSC